jgi:hypothetical protein
VLSLSEEALCEGNLMYKNLEWRARQKQDTKFNFLKLFSLLHLWFYGSDEWDRKMRVPIKMRGIIIVVWWAFGARVRQTLGWVRPNLRHAPHPPHGENYFSLLRAKTTKRYQSPKNKWIRLCSVGLVTSLFNTYQPPACSGQNESQINWTTGYTPRWGLALLGWLIDRVILSR